MGSSRHDTPSNRLMAHNAGKTRSTKHGIPWEVIHFEKFEKYSEAFEREMFLKSGVGRKWIKENIS